MNPPESTNNSKPVGELAADALQQATAQGGEAMRRLASDTVDLTQRSVEQWREQAEVWRDDVSEHIRAHPMRSVLVAAGAGMVLAVLMRALNR